MEILKSRFKFSGEYAAVLIMLLLALGGSVRFTVGPYDKYALFTIFLWLAFFFFAYLALKIPTIIISDDGMLFKTIFSKRNIGWQDIETIILTGKRSSFWRTDDEVSTLILKTGEKFFISVGYYKNSPQIRRLLDKVNATISEKRPVKIDPLIFLPVSKTKHIIPLEEIFVKYAGTPFLNFNAVIFYVFAIGLFVSTWSTIKLYPERLPILIIPIMAFYLGFGFLLHYVLVSDKYVVVKNAFWFWKKHVYIFDEVEEIVFEVYPGRLSCNAMRIITKDFRTKLYPAAGLWRKDWKNLKGHFESRKVRVRDHITI